MSFYLNRSAYDGAGLYTIKPKKDNVKLQCLIRGDVIHFSPRQDEDLQLTWCCGSKVILFQL